jgi:hypothetical protein
MGTAARSRATEAEGGAARELQQRQWCRRCRSEPAGKEDDGEETDGGSGEEAKWQRGDEAYRSKNVAASDNTVGARPFYTAGTQ